MFIEAATADTTRNDSYANRTENYDEDDENSLRALVEVVLTLPNRIGCLTVDDSRVTAPRGA